MAEIWTMGEMIVEIMREKKMSHWIKQEFFEDLIRAEHRRFLLIQWRDSDIRAELSEE